MIIDRLANSSLYANLSLGIKLGLHYLQTANLNILTEGKHEIDGDRIFALVQNYLTKPKEVGRYEIHRKYIDIQYIVQGEEYIGYANLSELEVTTDYVTEKDIQFLSGQGDLVLMKTGYFGIFFPEDAHMPCIAVEAPEAVKKIVIKIAL